MKADAVENDFEIWFDDSNLATIDKNQELPPITEEQERQFSKAMEEIFNQFFGDKEYSDTETAARIAV